MSHRSRRRMAAPAAKLLCLSAASALLSQPIPAAQQSAAVPTAEVPALLENARFVGQMGDIDESDSSEDTFIFVNGTFVSNSCVEWGFAPAPYWLRPAAGGLRFLAELKSAEHGSMRFEGVVRGDELSGTVLWKKERWYWTIEREYRFSARRTDDRQ